MLLLGGCGKAEPTSYESGTASLEKRDYNEAIEYFQDSVEAEEQVVNAWRGIGIAKSEQGLFEEAGDAFSKALELTEKNEKTMQVDLYLYLADALYHQESYKECVKTCDKLIDIRKVKDGYFLRGSAYLQMHEYGKAEQDFGRVISKKADYADYIDIYRIYNDCNLNADGEEYLEEALDISAKNAKDYYERGRVYYYLSEYEMAEKELEKALKKKEFRAAVYLGKIYVDSGDIKGAKKIYKESLERKEVKAEAYNGLAYCAILEEDYKKALDYIKKGLEVDNPEVNQTLLFNEIVVYEKKLDFDTAKNKMDAYLEQYPADAKAVRENYFLQTR